MREFLLMSLDHRLEIEQDARAALRIERCPRGLRGSRRGHCRLEIARTPQRHPCLNLARRGIVDILIPRLPRIHRRAVDEKTHFTHLHSPRHPSPTHHIARPLDGGAASPPPASY